MILACADPAIFTERYEADFNAVMAGIDILRTVEANPGCEGVQVNNALSETSINTPREVALAVLRSEGGTNRP